MEQAKELEKINAELMEFASIISHDLKSPMRAMRYYAEDIEQALGQDDKDERLGRARGLKQQARRMSRMLTDLLAYARIGHTVEAKARDRYAGHGRDDRRARCRDRRGSRS